MVNWFWRRRKRVVVPRLHSRDEAPTSVNKVDLADLTPPLDAFLAQAAYLQLTAFETLSAAIATAPTTEAKEAVTSVAALSLAKHQGLVAELELTTDDTAAAMETYAARIDEYRDRTAGATWFEQLVTCYVTAGLLDDFARRLSGGLPPETAPRVSAVLEADDGHALLVEQLKNAIDAEPKLASKLAMWGRRLVGDTLLIARSELYLGADSRSEEERIEPVFTELIAAHTRRMDALGLTA